jgi:cytochrome c-type biogenesis protein CcmH
MILFWVLCAAMIGIALAFLLPTLVQANSEIASSGREEANIAVYRDQISELETDLKNGIISAKQFQQDKEEIEKRLLEDLSASTSNAPVPSKSKKEKLPAPSRSHVYAVVFGIPIVGVLLYLQLGNQGAINGVPTAQPMPASASNESAPAANDQERIEKNVAGLAKRLEQNPGDLEGWKMLATSYTNLQRFPEAAAAYEKATALKPDDANLLADYAFAVAMKNGRKLQGQPTELLQKALKLDPENVKVLQLSGSAAFEAKNYERAIFYWEKVLAKAGSDPDVSQLISSRIEEAKKLAAEKK